MAFQIYDFVGQKVSPIKSPNNDSKTYFVREVLGDGAYVCDVYEGENHVTNHYTIKLDPEKYEKKTIRALFRVTEYFPDGPRFNERTETYLSVADIVTDAPRWIISKIIILCDSDCRALGIDPEATWPPVRPA